MAKGQHNTPRGNAALATLVPPEGAETMPEKVETEGKLVNPRFAHLMAGRPPSIKSPEELEARILEYLGGLPKWHLPTKAGLCVVLGVHRDTLLQYEKKPIYSGILKHYYQAFEDAWAQNLSRPNATGTIFFLKNAYGYVDRHENDNTNRSTVFVVPAEIAAKHRVKVESQDITNSQIEHGTDNGNEGDYQIQAPQTEGEQSKDDGAREETNGSAGADVPENQLEEKDSALPDANR